MNAIESHRVECLGIAVREVVCSDPGMNTDHVRVHICQVT